jgi:Uma2 family endonuclease
VPKPVIIVEVTSPSTRGLDASVKLSGYFSVASVAHYVMVSPDGPPVVHHARQQDGKILTSIITDGIIRFDPPGLEISVAELFGPL